MRSVRSSRVSRPSPAASVRMAITRSRSASDARNRAGSTSSIRRGPRKAESHPPAGNSLLTLRAYAVRRAGGTAIDRGPCDLYPGGQAKQCSREVAVPHPRDRRARLATSAVFFVQGLTFAGLLTQVAALQRRHGLTDGELAILLLCVPLIAGAGSALVGALAARHGSRRPLRAVQLLICLAAIAAGFAPDTAVLLAAVAVFGLGLGGVDAGMNMQAVAVERRYGRPILTGFHAVWSGAAVLSALWASAAAGIGLGLGTTIAAVLGPAAMLALVASTRLYGPAEERELTALQGTPGPGDPPRHGAPAWRPLLPLCLVMAFLYVGDSAVANFGSVFMDQAVSAEPYLVPLALGAYQAATFAVRVAGDHAVRRFGPVAIVRAGAVIAAAGFTA